MAVVLIDYGAGNLRSAAKALEKAGAGAVRLSSDPRDLAGAERIVLPGVGAFGACASALRAIDGMEDALNEAVIIRRLPFLGICVGMQLMADEGHEFGIHKGLGWVRGVVERMTPAGASHPKLKIPQIGWNDVEPRDKTLVLPGYAYFVHSYALCAAHPGDIAAHCHYGEPVVAAVQRENLLGVQFHPEKSQAYGLDLLARWLAWRP